MKKNMKNKSSMNTTEVFKEVVINSRKEVGINNISVGTNSISIGADNIHEDKNIKKVSENKNNLNERVTKLTNIISKYETIINKLESIEIKSDLNCLNKDQYLIGEMLQHCLQNGYQSE